MQYSYHFSTTGNMTGMLNGHLNQDNCVSVCVYLCLPWKYPLFLLRLGTHSKSHKGGRRKKNQSPWWPSGCPYCHYWSPEGAQVRHKGGRNTAQIVESGLQYIAFIKWRSFTHQPTRRPYCDSFKHGQIPWRPWRCFNILSTSFEQSWQLLSLHLTANGDLVRFMFTWGQHKGCRCM